MDSDIDNSNSDQGRHKLVWVMASVMALSFVFGVGMFIPAEHRAEKLDETKRAYQARKPGSDQKAPPAKKRLYFGD